MNQIVIPLVTTTATFGAMTFVATDVAVTVPKSAAVAVEAEDEKQELCF